MKSNMRFIRGRAALGVLCECFFPEGYWDPKVVEGCHMYRIGDANLHWSETKATLWFSGIKANELQQIVQERWPSFIASR